MKKKRIVILLVIFFILLGYFLIFSPRSPFKDILYPIMYRNTIHQIQPNVEPDKNTHDITFKKGTNLHAELLEDDGPSVTVREHDQFGGYADHTYAKADIFSIDIRPQVFPVTTSEILMKRLFPAMNFFRQERFTIFTDGAYSSVGPVVGILENLHKSIYKKFSPVIGEESADRRVCVVIFEKENAYTNYITKIHPSLRESVGVYSHDYRALFVDNSLSAMQRQQYPYDTVRHEAAHQFFYQIGLHFGWGLDRMWLVEGLALYCEPIRLGERIEARAQHVKKMLGENTLWPLSKMLKASWIKEDKMLAFYDQSWAFVYFLMEKHQEGFFDYLIEIKKHPLLSALKGDKALLEKHLGKDLSELEKEFHAFCRAF